MTDEQNLSAADLCEVYATTGVRRPARTRWSRT